MQCYHHIVCVLCGLLCVVSISLNYLSYISVCWFPAPEAHSSLPSPCNAQNLLTKHVTTECQQAGISIDPIACDRRISPSYRFCRDFGLVHKISAEW